MIYVAIIGLVWILCESKLFKPLRESISRNHKQSDKLMKWRKPILWFLDSIFNCCGCMGLWAGLAVYVIKDCEIAILGLCGSILGVFVISILKLVNRK